MATPRVLWKADVGLGHSNVVIQGGRLYTMGILSKSGFTISCLDAATGRRIWQRPFVRTVESRTTPAVDGESLFVLSIEGLLYGIDSQTGKEKWRKDLVADYGALKPYYSFAGSPVMERDLVLLTANTVDMALDKRTGQLVWSSEQPPREAAFGDWNGTDYSAPVLHAQDGRETVLLYSWKGLSSVDAQSERTLWQYRWELGFNLQCADPVAIGDRILLASMWNPDFSRKSILLETTQEDPRVIWSSPDLVSDITTPVVIDGHIYGCNGALHQGVDPLLASLRCVELATGRLLWEELLPDPEIKVQQISLAAANGTLIVLDGWGTLYTAEASPERFKEIARCDVLQGASKPREFWTPPVLCNAKIYCRNFSGDLVCIDVSK
ncbi:MAG: PQQ-binding-like beta-propeller repeat protein [Spirochaetes bacterium]|nr:PQQ-binding-like beta-propeller repeat protein [Spirochaetota bacterium]